MPLGEPGMAIKPCAHLPKPGHGHHRRPHTASSPAYHRSALQASNPLMQGLKTAALEQSRFAALEHLLRQSEAYTSFLAEQIKVGVVGGH